MKPPAVLALVLAACAAPACGSRKLAFVICPSEVHERLVRESDLGAQRELLYPLDYMVVAVHRTDRGVTPLPHFRWTHTTTRPSLEASVDLANPTHVSDYFAVDVEKELGIAVRTTADALYRVQWLSEDEIADVRRTKVLHLRPIEELALLGPRSEK